MECVYSVSNRVGRPRGIKNKKTLNRGSKADESRPQIENNTGGADDESIPEPNDALHNVINHPGSIHPELLELQTQIGVNQSSGPPLSVPPSLSLTPDINALNLSLPANDVPANDASLFAMIDSTAPWPTFRELADFSTSEVMLLLGIVCLFADHV